MLFLPGKFHGQRNLAGCSPWGQKKLDTTEDARIKTKEREVPDVWCLFPGPLPFTVLKEFQTQTVLISSSTGVQSQLLKLAHFS